MTSEIGKTLSGKPIYSAGHGAYSGVNNSGDEHDNAEAVAFSHHFRAYTSRDHDDAADAHRAAGGSKSKLIAQAHEIGRDYMKKSSESGEASQTRSGRSIPMPGESHYSGIDSKAHKIEFQTANYQPGGNSTADTRNGKSIMHRFRGWSKQDHRDAAHYHENNGHPAHAGAHYYLGGHWSPVKKSQTEETNAMKSHDFGSILLKSYLAKASPKSRFVTNHDGAHENPPAIGYTKQGQIVHDDHHQNDESFDAKDHKEAARIYRASAAKARKRHAAFGFESDKNLARQHDAAAAHSDHQAVMANPRTRARFENHRSPQNHPVAVTKDGATVHATNKQQHHIGIAEKHWEDSQDDGGEHSKNIKSHDAAIRHHMAAAFPKYSPDDHAEKMNHHLNATNGMDDHLVMTHLHKVAAGGSLGEGDMDPGSRPVSKRHALMKAIDHRGKSVKVAGVTKSGKAVYGVSHPAYSHIGKSEHKHDGDESFAHAEKLHEGGQYDHFSAQDHMDAAGIHEHIAVKRGLSYGGKRHAISNAHEHAAQFMHDHNLDKAMFSIGADALLKARSKSNMVFAGDQAKQVTVTQSGKPIYGGDHPIYTNAKKVQHTDEPHTKGRAKIHDAIHGIIRQHGNYSAQDHADAATVHDMIGNPHLAEAHQMAHGFLDARSRNSKMNKSKNLLDWRQQESKSRAADDASQRADDISRTADLKGGGDQHSKAADAHAHAARLARDAKNHFMAEYHEKKEKIHLEGTSRRAKKSMSKSGKGEPKERKWGEKVIGTTGRGFPIHNNEWMEPKRHQGMKDTIDVDHAIKTARKMYPHYNKQDHEDAANALAEHSYETGDHRASDRGQMHGLAAELLGSGRSTVYRSMSMAKSIKGAKTSSGKPIRHQDHSAYDHFRKEHPGYNAQLIAKNPTFAGYSAQDHKDAAAHHAKDPAFTIKTQGIVDAHRAAAGVKKSFAKANAASNAKSLSEDAKLATFRAHKSKSLDDHRIAGELHQQAAEAHSRFKSHGSSVADHTEWAAEHLAAASVPKESIAANSSSRRAARTKSVTDHRAAGQLHRKAAAAYQAQGNGDAAAEHSQKAAKHFRVAEVSPKVAVNTSSLDVPGAMAEHREKMKGVWPKPFSPHMNNN